MKQALRNQALRNQAQRIGLSPGSQNSTDDSTSKIIEVDHTVYTETSFETRKSSDSSLLQNPSFSLFQDQVNWLNFNGIPSHQHFEDLKELLDLHSLTVEDMRVLGQRPKLEVFDGYMFVVLHRCEVIDERLQIEQISLLLKRNAVVSLQEFAGNSFALVLDRIVKKRGRIRKQDSDYLFYCLIDAVIDQYFVVLESLQSKIDELETNLLAKKTTGFLEEINTQRQNLLWLRQSLRPLQNVLSELMEEESFRLSSEDKPFLQDGLEHVSQCLDNIEAMREMLSDLNELYMSYSSLRLNEIMKFLTMMSSIFIPLSFITGVFGMNFLFMPAISQPTGFFFTSLVMLCVVMCMVMYFIYKKWF